MKIKSTFPTFKVINHITALTVTLLSTWAFSDEPVEIAMNSAVIQDEIDSLFKPSLTADKGDSLFVVTEIAKGSPETAIAPLTATAPLSETISTTSAVAVNSQALPSRSSTFSIALELDRISYTIPNTLEDAKIQLVTLDGSVLSSVLHSSEEVGGAFDTAELDEGYYIVRLMDNTEKEVRLARAVAIKH